MQLCWSFPSWHSFTSKQSSKDYRRNNLQVGCKTQKLTCSILVSLMIMRQTSSSSSYSKCLSLSQRWSRISMSTTFRSLQATNTLRHRRKLLLPSYHCAARQFNKVSRSRTHVKTASRRWQPCRPLISAIWAKKTLARANPSPLRRSRATSPTIVAWWCSGRASKARSSTHPQHFRSAVCFQAKDVRPSSRMWNEVLQKCSIATLWAREISI